MKYKGIYPDKILECEADTEQEAQEKMKQLLLEMIEQDKDPVIVWCEEA